MSYKAMIFALALMSGASSIQAQTNQGAGMPVLSSNGWDVELKLGVNIGGAAPIPMPREIRKINQYNPKFNGTVEGSVTKWFGTEERWGASVGVKLEKKGMKTSATTKAYHTEIIQEDSRVAGFYTGNVKTNYSATLLTIPVMANYRISDRWKVRAGGFASIKLDGKFNGSVSDGYLRQNTPMGPKILFENGSKAYYDFTKDLRKVQWGCQLGGSWRADKHISLDADISYVFSNIFNSNFETITFKLHPVYLNLGVSYRL